MLYNNSQWFVICHWFATCLQCARNDVYVIFKANGVGQLDYWKHNGWRTSNRKRVRNVDLWSRIQQFSTHWRAKIVHVSVASPIPGNSQALRKYLRDSIRASRAQTISPPPPPVAEVSVAEESVAEESVAKVTVDEVSVAEESVAKATVAEVSVALPAAAAVVVDSTAPAQAISSSHTTHNTTYCVLL